MPQPSSEFSAKVFPDEYEKISERRVACRLTPLKANKSGVRPSVAHELVGLALSGGGIRSALFNLGLLQAFSHRGLLRYVDYLSSVSGGGYIAGHLAELTSRHGVPSQCFHDDPVAGLDCDPSDGRLANKTRIGKPDGHLANLLELARNYIVPTALNIALYLAVLGAVACVIAFIWRLFDNRIFRDYFSTLNGAYSGDELLVAFLPSLLVLLIWGGSTAIGLALKSAAGRRRHRAFLCLFLATAVIGLTVFSSNGVTAIGRQDDFSGYWSFGSLALWIGTLAGALQILSAVGMKQLLRSGREQAPIWQKFTRRFVSAACLVLPPLAMLHFMARDDISHYARNRSPDLVIGDIRNYQAFYGMLEQMPQFPHAGLSDAKKAESLLTSASNSVSGENDYDRWNNRPLLTWRGTMSSVGHLWGLLTADEDAPISNYKVRRSDADTKRQEQLDLFNEHVLPSHYFTNWMIHQIDGEKAGLKGGVEASSAQSPAQSSVASLWGFLKQTFAQLKPPEVASIEEVRTLLPSISEGLSESELLALYFGQAYPSGGDALTSIQRWDRDLTSKLNRLLLEAVYPSLIRQRTMNATPIVAWEDQVARIRWFGFWVLLGGVAWVALRILQRANRFPLYDFYRDALDQSFLCRGNLETPHRRSTTKLDRLTTCPYGMPYHLFLGSALRPKWTGGLLSVEREPFLFSELWCGLGDTYERTDDYAKRANLTLSDAVTISGAALTPWMTNNLGLILIMWLFNLRLGRDLPVPQSDDGSMVHVADGGFRDYFGLEELLRRRCKVIIVSDAGCNVGKSELSGLADVVRTVRGEMGIEFLDLDHECPFDVDRVRRLDPSVDANDATAQAADSQIPQQIMAMRVRYPADGPDGRSEMGMLFYVQMALCGTEDVDLLQIRKIHPNFPDESTLNQFFTGEQSESYRQLGYHIGAKLCAEMPQRPPAISNASYPSTSELEKRLLVAYQHECFRERYVDSQDAASAAIIAASLDLGDSVDEQADAFDELLRQFEDDPEKRRDARRNLLAMVRPQLSGHGVLPSKTFKLDRKQFVLTVMSCHELADGPVGAFSSRVFQIGGRRRLTQSLVQILPKEDEMREKIERFKGRRIAKEDRDVQKKARDAQWRASLLYLIKSQVFIEHGEETALLLKDLLQKGYIRQATLQAVTRQAVG